MIEVECFVEGCDFEGDREALEQHVRWIHLRENDFGENPLPALTLCAMNGLLRPEEFAETVSAILNGAIQDVRTRVPPSRRTKALFAVLAALLVLGFVSLMTMTWSATDGFALLGRLSMAAAIAVGAALLIDEYQHW